MDEAVIDTINNLDLQDLMPVFVIDDVALKANNHLLDHIHFYADAIKIILSMESPKLCHPNTNYNLMGICKTCFFKPLDCGGESSI